jgi:hypothetical protein
MFNQIPYGLFSTIEREPEYGIKVVCMDFLMLSSHSFAGMISFFISAGLPVSRFLRSLLKGARTASTSSVNGIVEEFARMSSEVSISLACFHWPSCKIWLLQSMK